MLARVSNALDIVYRSFIYQHHITGIEIKIEIPPQSLKFSDRFVVSGKEINKKRISRKTAHHSFSLFAMTPTSRRRLVREPKVDAKRWVDVALEGLLGRELVAVFGDEVHVGLVELDQVPVGFDAGWGHGFGEDGGAAGDCIGFSVSVLHI